MRGAKLKKSCASLFDKKEFEPHTLNEAINLLTYGCRVIKYHKTSGKFMKRIYYISEDDNDYLQYIPSSQPYNQSRIGLLDIVELREIATVERLKGLPFIRTLQITFSSKMHVLTFDDNEQRDLFWQGLQYFIELAESNCNPLSKQVPVSIDKDKMNFKEFKRKIRESEIKISKEEVSSLLDKIAKIKV